jgi:hypothetical protein
LILKALQPNKKKLKNRYLYLFFSHKETLILSLTNI